MSRDLSGLPIIEEIRRLCGQIDDQGREYWWIKPNIAAAFEAAGYHILPRHFYTPVADPETIAGTDFHKESYPLHDLVFSEMAALEFLDSIAEHAGELARQFPSLGPADTDFFWENPFFTGLDAAALFSAVRTIRPRNIVEIGSGFSTHISLRGLELNGQGQLTCVEPYPTTKLLELSDRIRIVQSNAQKAAMETFTTLQAGDILFIDSSHVSCLGSDVNFEIFEILPHLNKGVIVHFHDIVLPFEYPREWVIDRRWYWNEQYLLYAFLRMNDSYEIWMPNNYMIRRHPEKVGATLPFMDGRTISGVSFWMRKIR
jgi:predicted O-methyltransferase YrrM